MKKQYLATFELFIAALLWGFGFIAAVWALESLSASAIIFYRFFGAFILGIFILFLASTFSRKNKNQKSFQFDLIELKDEALISFTPGLVLWGMLIFQTLGLHTTTATNSGFITTLYALWVPLFRFLFHKDKLSLLYWFSLGLALIGTFLILDWQNFSFENLNQGDLLTLICSLFAAAHIILVGNVASKSKNSFAFNTFQSLWTALPCLLLFYFATESSSLGIDLKGQWDLFNISTKAFWGLTILSFGCSMIAFFLQVRAQQYLSPSTASLLFLMESPAAAIFAYWLLSERLSWLQASGAGLILLACILISLPNKKDRP